MSVHISAAAWKDKKTTGNARLLLLALADMANDEGVCWPSVATLQDRLNLRTDRAIRQILSTLETDGYIVRQSRSGHSNVYKINPTPEQPFRTERTFTPEQPFTLPLNSHSGDPGTVIQDPPEQPFRQNRNRTVIEPSIEPSSIAPPTAVTAPEPAGAKGKPKGSSANRGSRIPADFTPSDAMMDWARTNCPGLDLLTETDKFCDYWQAKAGSGALKVDWQLTWKTWMRTANEPRFRSGSSSPSYPTPAQRVDAARVRRGARLADELAQLGVRQ